MDLALTISRRSSDAPPVDTGGTRALTERLARGDESALGELYERWFDRMVGMAMAATGRDESFCMDAAQDAFVKLIRQKFQTVQTCGAVLHSAYLSPPRRRDRCLSAW